MKSILNKLFSKRNIISNQSISLIGLSKKKAVKKLFKTINNYSETSEVRYVGGCVRKSIKNEKLDDIDLAVNLTPEELSAKGNGGNRQMYNYVSADQEVAFIQTPPSCKIRIRSPLPAINFIAP